METITILTLKGGQAKTTTALNMTLALRKLGYKVLCIDLDFQKSFSLLLDINNSKNIIDLLQNKEKAKDVIQDDFIEGDEDILALDTLEPTALKNALEPLKNDYDYIIIDNHGIPNALTLNSLLASNKVIIPSTATRLGYIGFEDTISFLELIKKTYKRKLDSYLLITNYKEKRDLNNQLKGALIELANNSKIKVVNNLIRYSEPIENAQGLGENLLEISKTSNGAKDYIKATKEIFNL